MAPDLKKRARSRRYRGGREGALVGDPRVGAVVRDVVLQLPGQIWEASQEVAADCTHSGGNGGAATAVRGQAEGSELGDLGYTKTPHSLSQRVGCAQTSPSCPNLILGRWKEP